MSTSDSLFAQAAQVLARNDRGAWTQPAAGPYPHQWLWDSCFIAIGLVHIDASRAAAEIVSLARGQSANGMIPHMIYGDSPASKIEASIWGARRGRASGQPLTSAFTQPPIISIATELVARELDPDERHEFLTLMWPRLVAYHQWLYRDRDPQGTGLVTLVHPWESGWDNTPVWTQVMEAVPTHELSHANLVSQLRSLNPDERATSAEVAQMWSLVKILGGLEFDSAKMLANSPVQVQDLPFNALLIAANAALARIAKSEGYGLPIALEQAMSRSAVALDDLWDPGTLQYYSKDVVTGELIRIPTAATFVPLYARIAPDDHAARLRALLTRPDTYWTHYPVPTVPANSPLYDEHRYWRGPTWINLNWFVIRGLQSYGWTDDAAHLQATTNQVLAKSGFREYFSAITGDGLGAHDFSWSAALLLDLDADTLL